MRSVAQVWPTSVICSTAPSAVIGILVGLGAGAGAGAGTPAGAVTLGGISISWGVITARGAIPDAGVGVGAGAGAGALAQDTDTSKQASNVNIITNLFNLPLL